MPQITRRITFALPSEIAERIDEVSMQQGRSRSALIREALLRYIEDCEWREVLQYGEQRARKLGSGPEAVETLIAEYRSESKAGR